MGYGLHHGWAIEGAIGSSKKIDVSYLSPHAKMADRLEACTKQYKALFLFGDTFYSWLSPPRQAQCRVIDYVVMSGVEPFTLYTYDIDDGQRMMVQDFKGGLQKEKGDVPLTAADEIDAIFRVESGVSEQMRSVYAQAMDAYRSGDWEACRRHLEDVLALKPGDGPTEVIHDYIAGYDFNAPEDWKGYRFLDG
jgi:hypothetical protein